jgi:hypothetical protein
MQTETESFHCALNLRWDDSDLDVWMLFFRPQADYEVGERTTLVASPSTNPD